MPNNIKFRLFFNVIRFLDDDNYYKEVRDYYYWLYKVISKKLKSYKLYWFLFEEQLLDEE